MSSCGCRDLARIDFILVGDEIYFLEINTIPGMTEKSLYPKCALASGLPFDELTKKLITLVVLRQ